jgi:hypothetical protein
VFRAVFSAKNRDREGSVKIRELMQIRSDPFTIEGQKPFCRELRQTRYDIITQGRRGLAAGVPDCLNVMIRSHYGVAGGS